MGPAPWEGGSFLRLHVSPTPDQTQMPPRQSVAIGDRGHFSRPPPATRRGLCDLRQEAAEAGPERGEVRAVGVQIAVVIERKGVPAEGRPEGGKILGVHVAVA